MTLTKISNPDWSTIIERIKTRRCVPFLGAGVNVSAGEYKGLDLASGVTAKLVEDLTGLPVNSLDDWAKVEISDALKDFPDLARVRLYDLARVAFHVRFKRDPLGFINLLKEILPDRKRRPSKLLQTIARLPVPLIVTTNYDRLMERALDKASLLRAPVRKDPVALTIKLQNNKYPLAHFIRQRLSSATQKQLSTPIRSDALNQNIMDETERLLDGMGNFSTQTQQDLAPTLPPKALQETVVNEITRLFDDIKDPATLMTKLRDGTDPVSAYLQVKFSKKTRQLLAAFNDASAPTAMLLKRVICEINRLLRKPEFYAAPCFAHSADRPDIRRMITALRGKRASSAAQNGSASQSRPRSEALISLNRSLNRAVLQVAYPNEIGWIAKAPYEVVEQPIAGFKREAQGELQLRLAEHDGTIVYKIHGGFLDTEPPGGYPPLVVTEEDYIQFLTVLNKDGLGIPRQIKAMMEDNTLLFLGYGLEDWDFRTLFKGVIENLDPNVQRKSFALQRDPPAFWVQFWDRKGVVIYNVDLYEFGDELEQRWRAANG